MFTGTLTLCAFIALFGTVAAIAWIVLKTQHEVYM